MENFTRLYGRVKILMQSLWLAKNNEEKLLRSKPERSAEEIKDTNDEKLCSGLNLSKNNNTIGNVIDGKLCSGLDRSNNTVKYTRKLLPYTLLHNIDCFLSKKQI